MTIEVLKSKLHCVQVTEANLNYMGSITLDRDLMDAVGIIPGERVFIVNNNNGERFDTYTISGERGSGCVCLNGDTVIIMAYARMTPEEAKNFTPCVAFPENNRLNKKQ